MRRSRDDLAGWLEQTPTAFSYPFGVPGRDVSARTVVTAREIGFSCAVVNDDRAVCRPLDALALPRPVARNVDGATTTSQLGQFFVP
jgi:hypothetical protein